ncbi:MAG: dihydrolipoamide acetyltransferase family protein [Spirochaeta sp.]|jgi:pyruvate dehydrogenase E2 component (dihydrolipoamide acetyltransferase)|nr:dihydrolipoamide acetyltransferase family protein [Spirochaeta sp.]
MAETIVMPQAGNSVESCIVLSWRVSEGDTVAEGDIICEIETDKATMEVEATAGGTVLRRLAEEGDEVPVKDPLLVVGEPGESDDVTASSGPQATATGAEPATEPAGTRETPESAGAGVVRSFATGEVRVSPRARKRAEALGIDPGALDGSGPGGRVIDRDVLAAAERGAGEARGTETAGAPAADSSAVHGSYTDIAVAGVRKTIATRMHASLQESAQLTLQRRADARAVQAYRARVKEERRRAEAAGRTDGLPNITINHMVLFAVSRVLPRFPEMNAHFLGETIRRFAGVDLGFAVDTPKGLLVPTIRRADAKSLTALTEETGALGERALAGRATGEDLAAATFTVTNLGGLGIEWFTPVLNTPQVGILGVGAPVPGYNEDGEVVPQIGLSLTIDHRAVDGAPGARFLAEVARSIATFELTLAQ